MKRTKNLIILGVILVGVCAARARVKGVEHHIDTINTIDEEILSIDANALTNIDWEHNGEKLEFVKNENGWESSDDKDFPVEQDKIAEFLEHFSSVHASFIIDDVKDFNQYGLDDSEGKITFNFEDGNASTIEFGTFSTMDSKRYISIGNGSVYLIDVDLLEYISTNRDDFMLNDEIPLIDQVTKFEVSGVNNVTIVFDDETSHTYTDKLNYYLIEDGEYKPLSGSYAKTFINNIKNLSLKEYATYNIQESDLSTYGLDEPSLICTMEGDYTQDEETIQKSVSVSLGVVGEKNEEEDTDERKIYARVGDSKIIYIIDNSVYDALVGGNYDSLRPSEVVSANEDYLNSVEFMVDGTSYTLTVDKENEDEIKYTVNDYDVDFSELKDGIDSLKLSEVDNKAEALNLEFEFTLNQEFNGFNELNVAIYRLDGDSCVVKFNGETIGLIERSQMVDLREAATKMILNLGKDSEQ